MNRDHTTAQLELWGGLECTVNRVGDRYFDQIKRTGHAQRLDDLDRFAALGLRTLRYPLIWERTMPDDIPDWDWADARMARIRELGITPILGLVHHGSGPPTTNLLDPAFPKRLARFARAVAERYPWVTAYTPVNEPLTTARFSALYGHWYPHARDDCSFAYALIHQCRAVALAMQAIREVVPDACLVQTDDLGKTRSTPPLAYQATFENERRWATFDLLCGRITPDHTLWPYFQAVGVDARDLEWFQQHPCPPSIIGLNYYLSSERFIDERLDRYPSAIHGGNGRDRYADIEVARVSDIDCVGATVLLQEAWDRYHLPLAITESHNGSTREEQIRWLCDIWAAANEARSTGADVRAVTVWMLLGGLDWHTLVTREVNHYEPGVFDIRSPEPRPTALAHVVQALAAGEAPQHPALASPGWWQRPMRVLYGNCSDVGPPMRHAYTHSASLGATHAQPLLITGATGTLGQAFARMCELRGLPYYLLSRQDLDIADPAMVQMALNHIRPWAVVNAAGYVRVDDAEHEPERCFRENVDGPASLAELCAIRDIALLSFSSDLVFDGDQRRPYIETSAVAPRNVYGRSKAEAEARVLAAHTRALVVRTSAFFGPWDGHNFVTLVRQRLAAGQRMVADAESVISPTYVPDLVHTTLDLLIDGEVGLWHLASVLGSERGSLLPRLGDALERYYHECEVELGKVV